MNLDLRSSREGFINVGFLYLSCLTLSYYQTASWQFASISQILFRVPRFSHVSTNSFCIGRVARMTFSRGFLENAMGGILFYEFESSFITSFLTYMVRHSVQHISEQLEGA